MSLNELIERLERAAKELDNLKQQHGNTDGQVQRLSGKAEGVRLALSYVQEMVRSELA